MDRLPHEILHPEEQRRIDKEIITAMLKEHDLNDNVDLIYTILLEYAKNNRQDIDRCVKKVLREFEEKLQ